MHGRKGLKNLHLERITLHVKAEWYGIPVLVSVVSRW